MSAIARVKIQAELTVDPVFQAGAIFLHLAPRRVRQDVESHELEDVEAERCEVFQRCGNVCREVRVAACLVEGDREEDHGIRVRHSGDGSAEVCTGRFAVDATKDILCLPCGFSALDLQLWMRATWNPGIGVPAPLVVDRPTCFWVEQSEEIPNLGGRIGIGGDEGYGRKQVEADKVGPNEADPLVGVLVQFLVVRRPFGDL